MKNVRNAILVLSLVLGVSGFSQNRNNQNINNRQTNQNNRQVVVVVNHRPNYRVNNRPTRRTCVQRPVVVRQRPVANNRRPVNTRHPQRNNRQNRCR